MRMISYAQNGEDVVLSRVFKDRESGFYVDVGANDPVVDSVTMHFYERGWRGVNVEPAPGVFDRLAARRTGDVNLNVGLSDRPGKLTFHDNPNQGLSTFSDELADLYRSQGTPLVRREVPVTTLAAICEAHCDRPIDFMKIDVEGHEREVIEGGDWDRWRPRVLVIEATWPERWEHLLFATNYHLALNDGINRFYVRDEDRAWLPALSVPANVLDMYAPYLYVQTIEDLRARLRTYEGSGPITKGVARAVFKASRGLAKVRRALRVSRRPAA